MNELIEKLAERATKEMDPEAFSEDMNIPTEWYHKFTELIVKESFHIALVEGKGYLDPVKLKNAMCKHFGIE